MYIEGDNDPNVLDGTAAPDIIVAEGGDDTITGGGGDDEISGGTGDDTANQNVDTDGTDTVNLGAGDDVVNISGTTTTEVRLTFVSARVGNGDPFDIVADPQDGQVAVRLQREDNAGNLIDYASRYDDEGITFDGGGTIRFDVRDLLSGAQRGNEFDVVILGTQTNNSIVGGGVPNRNYYINAGMGNDSVLGGQGNDFLVGGAGNDSLSGGAGADSFIGGGGTDFIDGGLGEDRVIFNVSTDGQDSALLGRGNDNVLVSAAAGTTNVRLTFTSAEVGNLSSYDSGALANQDGGLAVRLQAEDSGGALTGAVSRFDDEGVTFVSQTAGMTFQVNDLVSGVTRGDAFSVVTLGDRVADNIDNSAGTVAYYVNGGQGADSLSGGSANDFLVGGAGDDRLVGNAGNDSFIGGAGADRIIGGFGDDTMIVNTFTDSEDQVNLGAGSDVVRVSTTSGATNVRIFFTSAEVGNNTSYDGGTLANQDGGLAVRLAEENAGAPSGSLSRYDDEGITFVSTAPGVLQFDVRDLVSGAQRGEAFDVVQLGTHRADTLTPGVVGSPLNYYVNGGQGADTITGADGNDFLVGGAGNDTLTGGIGTDSYIGGGGADQIDLSGTGADLIIYAAVGDTTVSSLGRDSITGFEQGSDRISLAAIDANTANGSGVNDVFVFEFDGGFDGVAGQLIAIDAGGITLVQGDVDGDGGADFAIIVDVVGGGVLTDTDFVL